jgi:hypothetical protein
MDKCPFEMPIDSIDDNILHFCSNCPVVQVQFNAKKSYTKQVYDDAFKIDEVLNDHIQKSARSTKNFGEQKDYRLSHHAKHANEKNKKWAKYFDESDMPEVKAKIFKNFLIIRKVI